MKIGDMVQPILGKEFPQELQLGIIIEVIDHIDVPPVVKILWQDGVIDEEWTDDIEVINASR